MPNLLFAGEIDFTVSQLNDKGVVNFCMYNHANDAASIYADVDLSKDDLIALKEWIDKELTKFLKDGAT